MISSVSGLVRTIEGAAAGAGAAMAAAAAGVTAGGAILARSRPLCFLPPFLMPVTAGLGAELGGSGAAETALLVSGAVTWAAADTGVGSGAGAGAGSSRLCGRWTLGGAENTMRPQPITMPTSTT